MKKSRVGWLLICLAIGGAWCAAAVADEVAKPWGTVHGNIYGTQSSDDPAIKFSDKWYNGATKAWEVNLRAADVGLERVGGRTSITFDEAGNLYFRSSTGGSTGGTARVASFSPTGVLRWKATTDGTTLYGLGTFRHTSIVVGDGGANGRCYVLGVTEAGPVAIALSKATGVKIWETPIPSTEADITPVLYDGKLFILGNAVSGATPFFALDSATGAVLGNSSIAFGTGSNGQMTLVPNAFGAGKHGLYYNVDRAMNAVLVDTTGGSITASAAWTMPGSNAGRSHVNYLPSIGRLVTHAYPDADTFPFHAWNLDGTGAVGYRPLAGWGDGFYDFAAIDFNGTDLLGGGSEGKIIRYKNIRPYVDPGTSGSPGTPESDGYYQFTSYYGDQRLLGGLYKSSSGKSIMVLGTRGNDDPNRGPIVDSFVYAANLTDGTLITSCLDYQDMPLLVDNFQIVGDVSGTVLDTAGFEGYALGNMAGQANPGGTGSLDANNWQDDNSGTGGEGTPVQIVADPTGGGHGNVVEIQPNGSCGGTKGIKGLLATPATTDNTITVSWDQYRGNLTDNVWYDAQEAIWYAMQWDSNGSINPLGNGAPWIPLTAGAWQHVVYQFDLILQTVTVSVDGGTPELNYFDPFDPMPGVYGWSWQQEATAMSTNVPETPQIFRFDTGMVDWFYDTHGGPQLGPLTSGVALQHIYYTNRTTGALVAIGPACNTPPSDVDGDGDVDLADFLIFQACFNGPNRPVANPTDTRCACLDSEDDSDVDLADFLVFQGCFNGPNRAPGCP
jgi:hypothetical protein